MSERGQLAERVTSLEETKQLLTSETQDLRQKQQAAEGQIAVLTSERDNLAAERSTLDTRLSSLITERDELATRHQSLATEREALARSLDDRFKELAQITKALFSAQDTLETEQTAARTLRNQLAETRGKFAEKLTTLETARNELIAERDARVASLVSERGQLAERVTSLEETKQQQASELQAFREQQQTAEGQIAALSTAREALAAQNTTLVGERGQLAERVTSLEETKQQQASELQAFREQQQTAAGQIAALTHERDTLTADLSARFDELSLLGKRILTLEAEADARVAKIQSQMDAMVARWTWKLGAPGRFVWDKTHNTAVKITRLPVALQIILKHRHSGFFNHEWYFEQNPDVKAVTARPFLHFAFHGVFEGRAPNPSYDESKYLQSNSSLKSRGKKPLLLYTLEG